MSSCTFHAKRSMFWLLPSVPPLGIPSARKPVDLGKLLERTPADSEHFYLQQV